MNVGLPAKVREAAQQTKSGTWTELVGCKFNGKYRLYDIRKIDNLAKVSELDADDQPRRQWLVSSNMPRPLVWRNGEWQ